MMKFELYHLDFSHGTILFLIGVDHQKGFVKKLVRFEREEKIFSML